VFRISPVEPWRIVRTRLRASGVVPGIVEGGGQPAGYFTGATGITIYRGDAMPDLKGMAIVGDVGSNLVHRKKLIPDGVGFQAVRVDEATEFVRSKDIWFRPVQFANGPDGCLHILDMYRETIEHPKSLPPEIKQHLDLTSGRDRGRLYRVTPAGGVAPRPSDLEALPSGELVQFLGHPNAWHRETASRLVYERLTRGDPGVEIPLANYFTESESPLGRLHVLRAVHAGPQLDPKLAGHFAFRALTDPDAGVRQHGVLLSERHLDDSYIVRKLIMATTDPDLGVRYQLAFTLGELPVEVRILTLLRLLEQDGGDRWIRIAALSSLNAGAGEVLALLLKEEAFLTRAEAGEVMTPLARIIGRQKRSGDVGTVLRAIELLPGNLPGVVQQLIPELAAGNPRAMRMHLGATLERILLKARAAAEDAKTPEFDRAAAMRLMRFYPWGEVGELLTEAIDPHQPAEVQRAAIDVFQTYAAMDPIKVLLEQWQRLSPAVRRDAEEVVCARTDGALALLSCLEAGSIQPTDITPGRLQLLQASKDADVKARAAALQSKLGVSSRQAIVEQYRDALNRRGDVERGRAVFRKTCAVCHKLENFGYELGPNLATIKNRGPEAIVLNVLDPNREVNPQYQSYLAVTSDGLTHTGMIQSETATAVTLSRGENKAETILRSEIEDLRSTGLSLMPEGLEKDIDVAALADLLAYLEVVK
ncbi:MAG: c-type cytochrome, partial [Planctomycetaceae bacterium]|nr:c-type cytochrome [Planctomycetaceae bacterium]